MKLKNHNRGGLALTATAAFLVPAAGFAAWTSTNAFVTPKSVTIQAKNFYLVPIDSNNNPKGQITIWTGNKSLTFSRSDTGFQRVNIGNVAVPQGRYNSAGIEYSQLNESVRLDGGRQEGENSAGTWDVATRWYSTAQSSTTNNSITTTANTSGELTNIFASSGSATGSTSENNSSYASFAPVCVSRRIPEANVSSTRKATANIGGCRTGDHVVRPPARIPAMTVVWDLTHYIGLDTTTNSARKSPSYPQPLIGDAGIAIHLTAINTSAAKGVGNVSLIYNDAGDLVSAASWTNSRGEENAKIGQGIGSGQNSAGNYVPGVYNNTTGAPATVAGKSVATGEHQFVLSGSGGVRGVLKISDPRAVACGSTVTLTPIATADSVFNASGFTQDTNLSGWSASGVAFTGSLVVRKVVNPGAVSGFTATCNYAGGTEDGYY